MLQLGSLYFDQLVFVVPIISLTEAHIQSSGLSKAIVTYNMFKCHFGFKGVAALPAASATGSPGVHEAVPTVALSLCTREHLHSSGIVTIHQVSYIRASSVVLCLMFAA